MLFKKKEVLNLREGMKFNILKMLPGLYKSEYDDMKLKEF